MFPAWIPEKHNIFLTTEEEVAQLRDELVELVRFQVKLNDLFESIFNNQIDAD